MDAILERKERAADDFLRRLLTSRAREYIAKVILHGSVAQGTAQPDSDVDLLIFGTGEPELVQDAVIDVGLEVAAATGESIDPLIYPYGEYQQPSTYFIFNALRKGRELYSMDAAELKRAAMESAYALGQEYLAGARQNEAEGRHRIAVDAAYNAAELAVKGLLLLRIDELPSSHSGIVNRFGEIYIKSGRLSIELSDRLRRSLMLRNRARYEWGALIGTAEASLVLQTAEELLHILRDALTKSEEES
jgi:uncharacterized protein (UPF0332 family)/predicted nucleotidyltransferase